MGIDGKTSELPFVYVYERSDFSTNFYGIQIYPEMVRDASIDAYFSKFFTSRFTMLTKFDENQDQYLEINLELRKGAKSHPYLKRRVLKKIISTLREKSSEFKELSNYLEDRAAPLVEKPLEGRRVDSSGGNENAQPVDEQQQ